MARQVQDAPLTTRASRDRLAVQHQPYWRAIEGGAAVGYRKGVRGGVWLARSAAAATSGGYRQATLGRADDAIAADGSEVLDWRQADKAARAWIAKQNRIAAGLEPEEVKASSAPYTVRQAVLDHLADLAGRGSRSVSTTRIAAEAHILPALGDEPVGRLTRDRLRAWRDSLAVAAPRRRRAKGVEVALSEPAMDADATRRRRASTNRILTILKASLNHARAEGKVSCAPDAWQLVKPFREADAPKIRYLTDAECVGLVNSCTGDFRNLVSAALLTGCRYGELAAMRVTDVDMRAGSATIPRSKSGKVRHVVLTPEAVGFFRRVCGNRPPGALVFLREAMTRQASRSEPAQYDRKPWGSADQSRPMAEACAAAEIQPAVSFHVLRHTHASRLATKGVPMAVIAAQLGHADTRMTERHYAHLSPSYVAETVRNAFGSIGLGDP